MTDVGLSPAERLPYTWPRLADAPLDRYALLVAGRPVGYIVLALMQPGVAWVGFVHIDQDHRGKGYGTKLHALAASASGRRLLVEQACSPDEARTVMSLGRRPEWRLVVVPGITYADRGVWALIPAPAGSEHRP